MNCFMGYNPLATKQVKVTVWVCEQDGATPVAPSNPSAGDCFIVYATDEAVLSNTPTSAKTYTNGGWADAEGGGGGDYPTFTLTYESMEFVSGTCDMTFAECKALCTEEYHYTCPCICIYYDDGEEFEKSYAFITYMSDDEGILFGSFNYYADGTIAFDDK